MEIMKTSQRLPTKNPLYPDHSKAQNKLNIVDDNGTKDFPQTDGPFENTLQH